MRKNFRKLVSIVLVVLLISAGTASPVVAETTDCSTADKVTTVINAASLFTISLADSAFGDGSVEDSIKDCIESMQEDTTEDKLLAETNEQTKLQIYQQGLTVKQKNDEFNAVISNYVNDSKSVAWMYAENAIAEAYQNGTSKAIAKSKARQAISRYYAQKQVNLITNWNSTVIAVHQMKRVSENESGVNNHFVTFASNKTSPKDNTGQTFAPPLIKNGTVKQVYNISQYNPNEIPNETSVTLVNSTEKTTKHFIGYFDNEIPGEVYESGQTVIDINDGYTVLDRKSYTRGDEPTAKYVVVRKPNSNYDKPALIVDLKNYKERWDKIVRANNDLQDKTDAFVNNTWESYQSGEIDASDVTSRNTKIFTKGIEGNESYADLLAAYGSMGLETPELNGTGTITMEYQGNTYEGMIFGKAPNGSWKTQTYNTQNINGTVSFVSTDANQFPVAGEFTITRITNKEGNEIQEVNVTRYNYVTTNNSEYQQKLDKILELYNESESREQQLINGPGNTGDAPQINLPDWLESELFGVPLWGILGMGGIGIYAVSVARREN